MNRVCNRRVSPSSLLRRSFSGLQSQPTQKVMSPTSNAQQNVNVVFDSNKNTIFQKADNTEGMASEIPNILVIGGPSGVGKGTVLKQLLDRHPELFSFSVSNTTRGPRPGEEDGVHYNFVCEDEFKAAIKNHEMLEYAHVHTNYYGTSAKAVGKVIDGGKCCVLDIDVQGAEQVYAHYKDNKDVKMEFVFFLPPSMDELEKRLRGRGTETEEKIQKRLTNAHTEVDTAQNKHDFWRFITNEVVEDSYQKLCSRISVESKEAP